MIQDFQALEQQYKQFVLQVIQQDKVWALVKKDEMAFLESQLYDGLVATPFFSSEAAAYALQSDDWFDFEVVEISLAAFLERWLIGLYNQDIMVAAIWNDVATGREFEPLELLLDFLEELKHQKIDISFEHYYSIADFILKIKDSLSE